MELRYLGFEQLQNARGYRFDVMTKGEPTRQFTVTVDLALFRAHRVGIQEGPSLCARKLSADLEQSAEGAHELTTEDMRAYGDARDAAEARRIESRNGTRRPKPAAAAENNPQRHWPSWRP